MPSLQATLLEDCSRTSVSLASPLPGELVLHYATVKLEVMEPIGIWAILGADFVVSHCVKQWNSTANNPQDSSRPSYPNFQAKTHANTLQPRGARQEQAREDPQGLLPNLRRSGCEAS
jgi:hypothetical protein